MQSTRQSITSNPAPRRTQQAAAEHRIRWVLAHDPPEVFEDASRAFAEAVREHTHGSVEVELYTNDEYAAREGHEPMTRVELARCVARGDIEMAHNYVSALGALYPALWMIELPFLFRDYEHAERVFESAIAERLMNDMAPHGVRGMCIAYSGGYRITPTTGRRLESLDDYRGMTIRTAENPVPRAMYRGLGASAVSGELAEIAPWIARGKVEAAEITYVRYRALGLSEVLPVVNETGHSLFTTMMVVNEGFFRGLTDAQQAALHDAARMAGKIERDTAIAEEQKTRDAHDELGFAIVRMADDQRAALRERALEVYDEFAPQLGERAIAAIRAA